MQNDTEAVVRVMLSALKMSRSQSLEDRTSPLDGSVLPKTTADYLTDDAIEKAEHFLDENNMDHHCAGYMHVVAPPRKYKRAD